MTTQHVTTPEGLSADVHIPDQLRELHLFAGAGGGILGGMLLGHTCVCAVEIEPYCRRVLLQRQRDGILPVFPIWDDVRTFDGTPWSGRVDVVCGGFPCQDISVAGKGAGIEGEQSGLWGQMARIICEVRPRFAFVENSPALASRGLGRVLGDLAEMGYDCRWGCVSGVDVGASQIRERLWILADSAGLDGRSWDLLEASRIREAPQPARRIPGCDVHSMRRPEDFWNSNPPVFCRGPDEVANQVDRLRAIGNGQIPAMVRLAWSLLSRS